VTMGANDSCGTFDGIVRMTKPELCSISEPLQHIVESLYEKLMRVGRLNHRIASFWRWPNEDAGELSLYRCSGLTHQPWLQSCLVRS
jgi:hypothetical protein